MSDAANGGGGGGSPFGGGIPGVSMTAGEAAPSAPDNGDGAPAQTPPSRRQAKQQPEGIPSPQRYKAPERARAGQFAPHVPNTSVAVAEVPENGDDPWSGLVDRNLQPSGDRAIERHKGIDAEAEQVHDLSDPNAGDDDALEVEAQVLDHEDADDEWNSRSAEYKKIVEQWNALNAGDDLPEALANKFVVVPVLDAEGRPTNRMTRTTIQELAGNRLRQADYTRKLREVYAYKEQLDQQARGMQVVQTALGSGDAATFLNMIEYLQAFPTFHRAALMYGERLDRERRMSPEQRQMLQALRQSEAEKQRLAVEATNLRAHLQQAQQGIQQQQAPADPGHYGAQLSQMLPRAFAEMEAEGTPYVDSLLTKDIWQRHWQVFVHDFDGELSTAKVKEVARGVMQEFQEYASRGLIPTPQPAAARMLPPVAAARGGSQPSNGARSGQQAGAPNYGSNGRQPQRARMSDINFIHRPTQR